MNSINHGTRGGYYAHRRLSIPTCRACRDAINKYVKEYRSRKGASRDRSRDKIRRKALATLREKYRDEYDELVLQFEAEEIESEEGTD